MNNFWAHDLNGELQFAGSFESCGEFQACIQEVADKVGTITVTITSDGYGDEAEQNVNYRFTAKPDL